MSIRQYFSRRSSNGLVADVESPPHSFRETTSASSSVPNLILDGVQDSDTLSVPDSTAEHYLRLGIACKFEGDIYGQIEKRFGGDARRGADRCPIDIGILLPDTTRTIGVEIKTAVMRLGIDAGGDVAATTTTWRGSVCYSEGQEDAAFLLISWPMLRDTEEQYWTLLHHGTGLYTAGKFQRIDLGRGACKSFTDILVPPFLWPFTRSVPECLDSIASLRNDIISHGLIDDSADEDQIQSSAQAERLTIPRTTTTHLVNKTRGVFHSVVAYLQDQLSAIPNVGISLSRPVYTPYTCDLFIETASGEQFFVGLVMDHCREIITTHDVPEDMISIAHDSNDSVSQSASRLIFGAVGGRWTFLLTEISPVSQRFITQHGTVPSRMILLHRSQVPKTWCENTKYDVELQGNVPRSCLINARRDMAGRLVSIIKNTADLKLPRLETITTHAAPLMPTDKSARTRRDTSTRRSGDQVRRGRLPITGSVDIADVNPTNIEESRTSHRQHQMRAHAQLSRACKTSRQGLPFDFEMSIDLRRYAFTSYAWTQADVEYFRDKPRCLPVQIFELPASQRFIYLSFGRLRWRAKGFAALVHPYVEKAIGDDAKLGLDDGLSRRIFVLEGQDAVTGRQDWSPIYAIPSNAIDYDVAEKRPTLSWSVWRVLTLKPGYQMEKFRFDSYSEIAVELGGIVADSMSADDESVQYRGEKAMQDVRDKIYDELWPGFREWL